jgi:5-methylcytosine-specific restriction endonuclease McrA
VKVHIGRANRLKLKASLTFKQWLATLDYFDWECAYCLKGFSCLEHYIPLSLNGGTTSGNCLPACDSCNAKKNNHHPDQLDSIFPAENLARIRQYLSEQSA